MAPSRMTANPKRPSRYRPGKGQDQDSDSEYETEEEARADQKNQPTKSKTGPSTTNKVTGAFQEVSLSASKSRPVVAQVPVIDEDEFETESEDDVVQPSHHAPGKVASGTSPIKQGSSDEPEEDEDDESSEEEDDESETSSEDEAPRILQRPTFVRKDQRAMLPAAPDSSQSEAHLAAEAEARRKQKADALVQEQLERNQQLKLNEKKEWDDSDNEGIEGMTEAEVDDTDNLDPEAERAAWKLRELKRVKRAREQIELAEREREEIERRRNLTNEERDAEDAAHLAAQDEEREGKGKAGYMQRYFHRGAFFQDSAYAEEAGLKGRDIMGSKFADQVTNREMLPEFMQIRDMAKLGRKGRTRYKDLKSEDTGRWGDFGRGGNRNRQEESSGNVEILDERFRPDDDRNRHGPSGANATTVSNASRREHSRKTSPRRERQSDNSKYIDSKDRKRRRQPSSHSRSRSRSRSRSPIRSERERDRYADRHRHSLRARSRSRTGSRSQSPAANGGFRNERESRFDKRVRVS